MIRRPIQQLAPSLINRIAAGEVIERPASVVKELVENSLDAGATSVAVEVEDGGRALIRIIDDGGGIPPGELPLAFAQHATSKLTSDEDLFRISTMGFRGEALASIGSVSQARIQSRTADSDAAWEIHNRGGELSDPQATAGNVGTTIEIRNLFFNTPARRKFLKGTQTEFGHISEMLQRIALAYPAVTFKLSHNGRVTFTLPAGTDEQRWLTAWPAEFHEQRLPITSRDSEIRLTGLIGLPELARPTARYQFLYLNGRHIRDKFIQHALREAYRGLTEPGRYPAAVLMLDIPPGDVDVNVHPTKIEVRFKDSGRIHGLIHAVVRERLLGSDLTPAAVAAPVSSAFANVEQPPRQEMRERLAAFFRTMPATQPSLPIGEKITPNAVDEALRRTTWSAPAVPVSHDLSDASTLRMGDGIAQQPAVARTSPAVGLPVHQESPPASPSFEPASMRARSTSAIQLHNSYLVAESDDGLVIIDQHALHERIMFEELLTRITRGPLESQHLLIPPVLRASANQIEMLEQLRPLLEKIGIDARPIGPDAIAVQAFPSFLGKLDPADFVREILEKSEQELLDLKEEELLHGLLDMMACKSAVKAGDALTPGEIEALLARRELVERSSNCPHGRPTTLRLTLKDLEKQFKRTGF